MVIYIIFICILRVHVNGWIQWCEREIKLNKSYTQHTAYVTDACDK